MRHIQISLLAIIFITFIGASPLSAQGVNVVLENFSATDCFDSHDSESNIAKIIAGNKDVLVLSCHIKITEEGNPFYKQTCADRRAGYLMKYYLGSYSTPTIVMNGQYNTKGTYPKIVTSAVSMARAEDKLAQIPLKIQDNVLSAELPDLPGHAPYELWFFAYDNQETMEIPLPDDEIDEFNNPFGLPPTKDVTFVNIVKEVHKLSSWDGRPESIAIPLNTVKADGYAIIAQELKYGSIHAVGHFKPN